MQHVTSDDVHLVFDDVGDKNGQPIVILTGIGGAREIWHLNIPAFVQAGYRVINLDARNQGASQRTPKGRRMSRHAMDVYEVIHRLDLKNVILLGNSMGAATCWAYLSLFGTDNIAALIDVDQSPKMIPDELWQYGFKELSWQNFPDYLSQPLGKQTAHHIDDRLFAEMKKLEKTEPYDPKLNEPLLIDHAFQDWRDVLGTSEIPQLIIAGGKSPFFDPKFAQLSAHIAPHGVAKIIPDAGHIVMAEQPEAFNQTVLEFLNTNQ